MKNKNLMLISMLLILILGIGITSAAEDLSEQISNDISIDSGPDELSIESNDLDDKGLENTEFEEINGAIDEKSDSDSNLKAEIQTENKTFDAIQNAISKASENDTIILNGTYTSNENNMVIVNKAVTIKGVNNAILDGNHFKTRFRIDCPNVVFKDICFKNFKFDDYETAIIMTKNGVTVDNCNFTDNSGKITAILASGGDCKISNCRISSNANDNAAIQLKNTKTDISNCIFNGNKYLSKNRDHDMSFDEDAILFGLIISSHSKLALSNSNFYSNKISGLSMSKSDCTVNNCIFNNTESAIYSTDSNTTIRNSLFTKLDMGIKLIGGKNTVSGCNFTNNKGTPVMLDNDYYMYDGSFLINNSRFINNTNKNGPSAIYAIMCGAKIVNCVFKNNSGLTAKGVIFLETKSSVTIANNGKTQNYKDVTVLDNALKAYPYLVYKIKKSFTTSYKSRKLFTGKVIYGFNNKTWSYFDGICYIEKGKKEYWEDFGAKIKIDFSKYAVGKYKAIFCVGPDGSEDFVWRDIYAVATIKITKAKTIVKAPKVSARFKKSKYFKVTVKNKDTKKAMSKVKVKIKVYTGKKHKTYTVKTNKKGMGKLNTKKLKRGKHKVVISSGNKNCIISKKSKITII